jgi:DnaJ-class molecular chaperone
VISETKPQPVAACTVCGAFGYSMRYIGERCGKPAGGRRCAGIRARVSSENWKLCPRCAGSGRDGDDECRYCLNRGWLHVRTQARAVAMEPEPPAQE